MPDNRRNDMKIKSNKDINYEMSLNHKNYLFSTTVIEKNPLSFIWKDYGYERNR